MKAMNKYVEFPKVELHCHLDGSLTVPTIEKLAENMKISLPKAKELRSRLMVDDSCADLTQYLKKFELPLSCLKTKENYKIAAYHLMEDAASEHVMYQEIRFAPLLTQVPGLSPEDIIEAVISGIRQAEQDYEIKGNVIICCMRHFTAAQNMDTIKSAREFLGNGVCAIDLAGDEIHYPTKLYKDIFVEAQRQGMPFTIHSGESGSVENVRDAIAFGAKRIGHGIALEKDEALMAECAKKGIGIEMCPTSNLHTKAVRTLEEYPIKRFMDQGIRVTVNTDNRSVSNTTLSREFDVLSEYFDIDVRKITENAIAVSFADDVVKQWMVRRLSSSACFCLNGKS